MDPYGGKEEMMKNVEIKMDKGILTITVDTTKEYGRSKSGKTTIVASTEGNVRAWDVTVGLNVYK